MYSAQVAVAGKMGQAAPPAWTNGKRDKRAALSWDTSQTVTHCAVNDCATLAVVDTGAYKTILDIGMARMLGLRVREAIGGDCGTYSTPGTSQSNCYAGVVEEEVILQLAPGVMYGIQGLKLLRHPSPMFLVGSDVLSGGRPRGQWNYAGVTLHTSDEGVVRGHINF